MKYLEYLDLDRQKFEFGPTRLTLLLIFFFIDLSEVIRDTLEKFLLR
jgi:hypothetical protein